MTKKEFSNTFNMIDKAWQYLNPRYSDSFEVSKSIEGICIFIPTKWSRNMKKHAEEIKKIFNAKDVMFVDIEVEEEPKNFFWSIRLTGSSEEALKKKSEAR